MVKQITYGVISDVHGDPRIVPPTIDVLKRLGADKLLINGDIGNQQDTIQKSQDYVAFILESIGQSGLESFVQPGSHEPLFAFSPVMDHFSDKYSNLIDVTKNQKVEQDGHSLIFLPGSDFLCRGEYQIGNNPDISSGRYAITPSGLIPFEDFSQLGTVLKDQNVQGFMQYANMNDLRTLVTDPDKSIVVCHVPRKFDNIDNCVDVAHFHQQRAYHRDFTRDPTTDWTYTEISVQPGVISRSSIEAQGIPTFGLDATDSEIVAQAQAYAELEGQSKVMFSVERKQNRGNTDLKDLYRELGITKAVSGHFHESGHRAHDLSGENVPQGSAVTNLFWNSGHLDAGQTGILTVRGDTVKYQNIDIREYLR